jgi:tartrate dehydratase beta subunit/fumarate hydratase class I family protein
MHLAQSSEKTSGQKALILGLEGDPMKSFPFDQASGKIASLTKYLPLAFGAFRSPHGHSLIHALSFIQCCLFSGAYQRILANCGSYGPFRIKAFPSGKRLLLLGLFLFSVLGGGPWAGDRGESLAAQVTLQWDPNTEPNLAGYRVYYGEVSRNYSKFIDVGNQTTCILSDLEEGKTYYISATAYDTSGVESPFSNEVTYQVPGTPQCTYSISPSSLSCEAQGCVGSVNVATQAGCTWTIENPLSWVTVRLSGATQGSGTVNLSIAASSGTSSRTGTVSIAGQSFHLSQSGLTQFTITATSGPNGSISPSGTVPVLYGGSQSFTIAPNAGYRIQDLKVDGNSLGPLSSYRFSPVTSNHTIEATFIKEAPLQYALTITKTGSGNGIIAKSPDASLYDAGTAVTLRALPDAQSTFGGWSGGCTGTSPICTLTMTSNLEVIANFSLLKPQNNAAFVDINGDGKNDILWFDRQKGNLYAWYLAGSRVRNVQFIRNVDEPEWKMVGCGNADGKGRYDIFWHNESTGQIYAWSMQGEFYQGEKHIATVGDTHWRIVGTADFNGDQSTDLLWHNRATGEVHVWFMNGSTLIRDQYIQTVPDLRWIVLGVGDLNGDQNPDILWQHQETGDLYVWFMRGASFVSDQRIRCVEDLRWKVLAVGDFNQDLSAEILWQHQETQAVYLWYLRGASFIHDSPLSFSKSATRKAEVIKKDRSSGEDAIPLIYADFPQVQVGFEIQTSPQASSVMADFNQDGHMDLLTHDQTTGQVHVIFLKDNMAVGSEEIAGVPDTNWKIVGAGDFDKDGNVDLLWHHMQTGGLYVWFMGGPALIRDQHIATIPDTQWKVVGVGDFNRDGNLDILWQHQTNGLVYVWYMDGPAFLRDQKIATLGDPRWQIIRVADFNDDGHPDILWQHPETGALYVWHMNGPLFIHEQNIARKK